MAPKRSASPAAKGAKGGSYADILAEIERTSTPKPGCQPPTDIGTTAEGKQFLEENAKKAGVVSLPCGMQYKVLKATKQKDTQSPKIGTECQVHYRGTLMNGTEFDTSKKPANKGQPANFAPNKVIQGWTIAMQLMGAGDKWQLCASWPLEHCRRSCTRCHTVRCSHRVCPPRSTTARTHNSRAERAGLRRHVPRQVHHSRLSSALRDGDTCRQRRQ